MKNTVKFLFALAFAIFAVGAANAQNITSGTIDFSVTTPSAFDLRNTSNAALQDTVTFADAGPNDTTALTKTVVIQLRSNADYQVTALRTGAATVADGDGARFDASDISVQVTPSRTAGGLVNAGADTVNSGVTKLSDIVKGSGSTQLMFGDRISLQGDNNSSNFMTASLKFDATHQYYTPETYSEQITLGISAKP